MAPVSSPACGAFPGLAIQDSQPPASTLREGGRGGRGGSGGGSRSQGGDAGGRGGSAGGRGAVGGVRRGAAVGGAVNTYCRPGVGGEKLEKPASAGGELGGSIGAERGKGRGGSRSRGGGRVQGGWAVVKRGEAAVEAN